MPTGHSRFSRRHALALCGAGLFAPAVIRNANAAEVTLRLHHFMPPVSAAHRTMFKPWADKVMKESGGRIQVQIFPSMSLGGKAPDMMDQIRDGVTDLGWALPHYQPDRFPIMETWTLPFMITNATQTGQAIAEYMNTYGEKEFSLVRPIAWWAQTPGIFMTKGFPVKTGADIKGKRIRGGNKIIVEALNMLGANGVFFPVTEVAQNLTSGVADGVALPYEIVPAFRLHELVDHFSAPEQGARNLYTVPMLFAMNNKRYESLPPDLRKVIDDNSGMAVTKTFGAAFDAGDAIGKSLCEKKNATFSTISRAEVDAWRKTTQPLVDGWIAKLDARGHDGKKLVEAANALVDKYANS